jgi:hypothetical protein
MRISKSVKIAVAVIVVAIGAVAIGSWYCYPEIPPEGDGSAEIEVNQEKHEATGFGKEAARVDSQITFKIPDGQADAVYEYLKGKYVAQKGILKEQFPALEITGKQMSDASNFTDSYYDTPTLALYRNKNSCRHRTRLNTTNPDEDRKSGRELVQMKVTPPGQFTMRSEVKFKCDEPRKPKDADDYHPLIRRIDPDLRADFKQTYADAKLNAFELQHIFTIEQLRRRGYIDLAGKNIMSFSVDTGKAHFWWAEGHFASVDFGLVEVAFTQATEEQRKQMWAIRDAMIADFKAKFPGVTQNSRSKYQIVLEQLMHQIPVIPLAIRLGAVSQEIPR